jgi:hypothetical protein
MCNMPRSTFGYDGGGPPRARELRKGPLLAAVARPVLFAVFGTALVGDRVWSGSRGWPSLGSW